MTVTVRTDVISGLKRELGAVAADAPSVQGHTAVTFGVPEMDHALSPEGLAAGSLHEFSGATATGLVAALAGRTGGAVLWCARAFDPAPLYPPGLARFGLDMNALVLARARHRTDALWVAEEAMKSGAFTAVILEADFVLSLTHSRRLQLSLEESRTLGLVLSSPGIAAAGAASAARTRWRVTPHRTPAAPGPQACWRLELLRSREGRTRTWEVVWHDTEDRFDLLAPSRHGPARTHHAA